jgi:hypothetical protein
MTEPLCRIVNRYVGPVEVILCAGCGWSFADDATIFVRFVPLAHEGGVIHDAAGAYCERCVPRIPAQ